jgi:hypothetical protein
MPEFSGNWDVLTIKMHFWILTDWNGNEVLQFLRNRHEFLCQRLISRFWIRPDMWIFLPKWNVLCK